MNHRTISDYLTEPESIAQLKSFSVKQIAAIYNLVIDNPTEPSHNFSVARLRWAEPTASLSDAVLMLVDLNPDDFLLVEEEIIEAIRAVEAERNRIWEEGLSRAAMRQEVLNTSAA